MVRWADAGCTQTDQRSSQAEMSLLGTPNITRMPLISLVDEKRQWFKSKGIGRISFWCLDSKPLVVEDALFQEIPPHTGFMRHQPPHGTFA